MERRRPDWRQHYSSQFGGGEPYPGYRHPPAPTKTEWVKFESDDLTEFHTYEQATAMEAEPLDYTVNWALTDQEADEIEELGLGVPYGVGSNRLQPLPDDVEVDPATLDPDEVPAGSLPRDETKPTVTDVQPAPDSIGVPVGTKVNVTFSEPAWEPKITLKDSAGTTVQGVADLDTTRKVLIFTPAQPLKPATAYSAEMSEAYDEDGNEVTSHSWVFTTENDTTPPAVCAVTDVQFTLKDPAGTAAAGTTAMDATHRVLTFTVLRLHAGALGGLPKTGNAKGLRQRNRRS